MLDDVQQIGIEALSTEIRSLAESIGITLDDEGIESTVFRPQLASDDDWSIPRSFWRPVLFGPLADLQFETEFGAHVSEAVGVRI